MDLLNLFLLVFIACVPTTESALAGTFFWKPRLGIDLSIPTTESSLPIQKPTPDNIKAGMVMLIDGYQIGITIIGLASGLSSGKVYPHLDLSSAFFYTNVYRWALRYLSLIPVWFGGHGGNFCDTHRVWKRRFYYMDEFVPTWLRKIFPYVKDEEWEKEMKDYKKFRKYAEPAFGKHFRYPSKKFRDFRSQITKESLEPEDSNDSFEDN